MGLASLWKKAKKLGKYLHEKAGAGVRYGRKVVNKVNGLLSKGSDALDNMGTVGKAIKMATKTALNKEYKGVNPSKLWEGVNKGVDMGERVMARADKVAKGDLDEVRKISDELYSLICPLNSSVRLWLSWQR